MDDWSEIGGHIDDKSITVEILNDCLVNVYNQHYLLDKDVYSNKGEIVPIRTPFIHKKNIKDLILELAHTINRYVQGDVLYIDLSKPNMEVQTVRTILSGDIQKMNIPLLSVSNRLLNFGVNLGKEASSLKYE